MNIEFVPGLKLCEQFYGESIRPIIDTHFPGLSHAAALIGSGSEVLGFDDEMSTDHHWGPRVMLFVCEEDHQRYSEAVRKKLAHNLPYEFRGYPSNFTEPNPDDSNVQLMQAIGHGPVNHRVSVHTVRDFFKAHLGFDVERSIEPADWLTFSEQRLLTITAGAIYHDDIGLEPQCRRFSYYPRDVWLYLLAAGWARIGQEEHLMGRAGILGDEIGAALIGSRLVRDVMRLCFLMESTYTPYIKWFGTAFERLDCAQNLQPIIRNALRAVTWQERESHLVAAYQFIAKMHNSLDLTEPLTNQTTFFHGRPFKVIALHGFAEALLKQIRDPLVRRIAERPTIGSLDQFSDNNDLVSNVCWRPILQKLYR